MKIRAAQPGDIPAILGFIRELAVYEHMEEQVVATPELLQEWLFDKHTADALICEVEGVPVGWALYFSSFSTFLGRGGIYLEDLYVQPASRGMGCGKALLKTLAKQAVRQGCGRLEWACLDWNTPSLEFYKSLGAEPQPGWVTLRLTGETLKAAARD